MNDDSRYIEELSHKALLSVDPDIPPVPVEKIAEKLGITIVPFDFPDSFSGVFKQERRIIGVNKNHPLVRRRFTIAHELGHFVLGHEDDTIDERLDKPAPLEREANTFASFLLMPKKMIEKAVAEKGIDLKALSLQFLVSEQALTIRLLQAGLIK